MPQTASISQTALRQQSFDFQPILYSQYMMVQCIFLALPAQTSVCMDEQMVGEYKRVLAIEKMLCVTSHPPNTFAFSVHLALEDTSA